MEKCEPVSFEEFVARQDVKPGAVWTLDKQHEAYDAYVQILCTMGPDAVDGLVKTKTA